jgi:hypothetical protein
MTKTTCIECQHPSESCVCDRRTTMKPMLSVLIHEAVKLALIDSVLPDVDEKHPLGLWTDEERERFCRDVYAIPSAAIARMDPVALAQNVTVRLLGSGGFSVNGVYAGNATPRAVFEASLERPDQDAIAEIVFDMGLTPMDDETEAPDER